MSAELRNIRSKRERRFGGSYFRTDGFNRSGLGGEKSGVGNPGMLFESM